MDKVYEDKGVPKTFIGKWRSIEFELIFNSSAALVEFVSFVEENRYDDFVTIKYDDSIEPKFDNADEQDREVVVSYVSGKEKIVKDICRFLKGRAYVNKSCGTHVHFDMRGVKEERVILYGKRLAFAVPALKQIIPKSRRDSEYCERPINTIHDSRYNRYNRYAFVNMLAYNDHQTIEVRGHAGTLNARKILNWIKICEAIMKRGRIKGRKEIESLQELIEHYKLSDGLAKFVNKRYEEVNIPPAPPVVPPDAIPAIVPVLINNDD